METINELKELIKEKNKKIQELESLLQFKNAVRSQTAVQDVACHPSLSQEEILRYSRQIILPEIGVAGQLAIKNTSVIIIGAGGLGCPVAMYLAAAGVGEIGVVDHDIVEVNNLHRQIAHTMEGIGEEKSTSLMRAISKINPHVKCHAYTLLIDSTNIETLIKPYSIIVDASDNVPTRYLLNDAAVLYQKVLVSGSALRFEGQLTVYNYLDGPCYRCLFPKPPAVETVSNCSDSGILGAVTGTIGSLQALEVIKIAANLPPSYHKKMLLLDGLSGDMRVIKLRHKRHDCEICGTVPSITQLIDYEKFCNRRANDKNVDIALLPESDRISCATYKDLMDQGIQHVLLDVRPPTEVDICKLPFAVNIPMDKMDLVESGEKIKKLATENGNNYVICRRGNDSQKAVLKLRKLMPNYIWKDIVGGYEAWHHEVDPLFPLY